MASRALRLLVLACLVASAAWAAPPPARMRYPYPVEFRTFPNELWVYRYHPENSDSSQDDCLGLSGRRLLIDIGAWELKDDWLLYFVYLPPYIQPQQPHFRPQESEMVRVRAGFLAGVGRYPASGVYRASLTWEQWGSYYLHAVLWRYWWAWLGLAALVGVPAYLAVRQWRRAHQALRREAQRTELTADMFRGDPLEGQILGDHLLLSRIGEGGMGIVYRAVPQSDPDPAKAVAIKLLRGIDQDQRERFFRECLIYQRFHHPNILTVLETGLADVAGAPSGWPYLVTELVQGQSLRQVIASHPEGLTLRVATTYLVQIMRGLAHAHQMGVIHRDIKPENVLVSNTRVDGAPRLVIMDFGLARRSFDSQHITDEGNVMGTPAYMAPEQLRGEPCEASDQYSLGVIAYEMLCGSPPFRGDNPAQLIMQQLHHDPPSLGERKPNLPDPVVQSVHRMLRKEPDERYHHIADVAAVWEKLLPKSPARKESASPRPGS